ncbi:MAG: AMP-binding enzyme [Sellimonas intestinalis]
MKDGITVRGYRTGDEGYLNDGELFYCGRIDLQIKLHGYRIELGDIESHLLKLSGIKNAAAVANMRDGKAKSITAFLVMETVPGDAFAESLRIKRALKEYLPDYMIPKKLIFLDQLPMTSNGKADRKALGGMLS